MAIIGNTKRKSIIITESDSLDKKLIIDVASSASSNTATTLRADQTTDQTILLPDATTTLLGTDSNQTITNKTINAPDNTLSNISDGNIDANASISFSKMAGQLDNRVVVTDGSGFITTSDITFTEINYLDGVTSNIQTQLDAKIDSIVSTDNAVVRYDGIAGAVQNSTVTINDSGDINIASTTTSTTTGTGSMVVAGGVGIAENLNVGGDVVITGDLQVDGDTTTVNTETLNVEDANITVNNGGNQASANNTAGITIEMSDATNASIIYDSTADSRFRIGDAGSEVEVVVINNDQKIQNKRFADNNTLRNNADNTKVVSFDLSPGTTGTFTNLEFNQTGNRNIIFPDADTTLIGQTESVNVENKILITTNEFADGTDSSKRLNFNLSPATASSIITIEANHTANRNIILPDADTNLVGNNTTDTLTNKTFNDEITVQEISTPSTPPSGFVKIYAKNDQEVYKLDSSGTEKKIGAGIGGITINYFSDFTTEDISLVDEYEDGGSEPVDGTGTTTSIDYVSSSLETTNPLYGESSYKLAFAGGASGQGEGWSIQTDETLGAAASPNKKQTVQFTYSTTSGYATGDVSVWVYKDNSGLFPLSGFNSIGQYTNELEKADNPKTFVGNFNFDGTDTFARIIFHIAGTNTTAWDILVDNLLVGEKTDQIVVGGGVVGEIMAFANDSVPTDFLVCDGSAVSRTDYADLFDIIGTTWGIGDGSTTFNLPDLEDDFLRGDGVSNVGTSETDSTAVNGLSVTSAGSHTHSGTATGGTHAHTTTLRQSSVSTGPAPQVAYGALANPGSSGTLPSSGAHTHPLSINSDGSHSHPLSGDSETRPQNKRVKFCIRFTESNTNIINSTTQAFDNVYVKYRTNAGQSITTGNTTIIDFEDVTDDQFDTVTTGAGWNFEAPIAGKYLINSKVTYIFTASSTGSSVDAYYSIYRNGSVLVDLDSISYQNVTPVITTLGGSHVVELEAGDTIDCRLENSTGDTITLRTLSEANYIDITKLPDLSVVGNTGVPVIRVESLDDSEVAWPITANQYGDITSIELTPGTWDITASAGIRSSGAPGARTLSYIGISTTTGNSSTGLNASENYSGVTLPDASGFVMSNNISKYRVTVLSNTTYYLKGFASNTTNINLWGYHIKADLVQ